MKKLIILPLMAVALQAHAQVVVNPGDVILAFHTFNGQTGGQNLEVDLGPISDFQNATGAIPVGGLSGADLSAVYGSPWPAQPDLFFGIFAADSATNTVWLSNSAVGLAPQEGNENAVAISGMEAVYQRLNGATWTNNSGQASVIPVSDPGSYTANEYTPYLTNLWWGTFPNIPDVQVTGEVSSADLYQFNPGSGPATLLGTFELWADNNGPNNGAILDFVAVPEPSSALLAVAGLVLVGWRLRPIKSLTL